MQLCSTDSLIEYDLGKWYISPIPQKTPPALYAIFPAHYAVGRRARHNKYKRGFASWAKVISCTTFPTNHRDDTGLDGSRKWDTFVSLRPFIRCKQILIYYSDFHLQRSPLSLHTEGKQKKKNKVNKTFLSLLHAAAAAGLNSKELSLNFHPVSVFRWEMQWRKEGRGWGW